MDYRLSKEEMAAAAMIAQPHNGATKEERDRFEILRGVVTEGEFKSGNQNKSPLSVETQRIAQMIAMAGKGEGQQEESSREEKNICGGV
ncbi:hypothetical protein R2R35_19700 [Anaerocolumna sp. AGMB13020]|uniref:hypothetical protein n=1 Tax=Anaerocolumna sp. AGMB13020 TaxID=3081750 RepID=UPI002953B325|nr:hypothetical protein [Anaerocolumna sp. AGMB13020]WOO35997.1 hypothetical protein R2R35_19700 [Anaerocolumna sp. AGMB13020]